VVLGALAEFEGARAIAESLVVSPHTVKTQLQSIYRKLGVSSRDAALAVARELGLLDRRSE
jgi:LuxR family maltose regulon positive regulatory protein